MRIKRNKLTAFLEDSDYLSTSCTIRMKGSSPLSSGIPNIRPSAKAPLGCQALLHASYNVQPSIHLSSKSNTKQQFVSSRPSFAPKLTSFVQTPRIQ